MTFSNSNLYFLPTTSLSSATASFIFFSVQPLFRDSTALDFYSPQPSTSITTTQFLFFPPRRMSIPRRPRAYSVPVFSISVANGRSYIDSAHNKREYETKTENVFNVRFTKPKDTDWMLDNACDEIVFELRPEDNLPCEGMVSSKDGSAVLTRYTIMDSQVPTICAPGGAPQYMKPKRADYQKGPLVLQPDPGLFYMDEHAEKFPKYQYEPLVRATGITYPSFRFDRVDIVVSRTVLSNLLRLIRRDPYQPFHLDLDMEGNTLFVGRKVRHAKGKHAGYRHTFEAALTAKGPELKGASTHHRASMYMLAHLNTVVRYEVDAYDPDAEEPNNASAPPCHHPECTDPVEAINYSGATIVIPKGSLAKQHQLVEIKSNTGSRPVEQMWFGRTPICCLGQYNKQFPGQYSYAKLRTKHVTPQEFEEWETKSQVFLQKLVWLLQRMRDIVALTKDRSAVFVALNDGCFTIHETKERVGALPKELVEHFWSKNDVI